MDSCICNKIMVRLDRAANESAVTSRKVHTMAVSILSYTVRDADGDRKSVPFYWVSSDINTADLQDASDTLATFLDGVIDGVIESASVTLGIDLPSGLKGSPVANSEVQKGALLHFTRAGTSKVWSIFIPTWTPSKFTGDVVNDGAAGVSSLTTTLVTGITESSGNVLFSDNLDNDLTAYRNGEKTFRK